MGTLAGKKLRFYSLKRDFCWIYGLNRVFYRESTVNSHFTVNSGFTEISNSLKLDTYYVRLGTLCFAKFHTVVHMKRKLIILLFSPRKKLEAFTFLMWNESVHFARLFNNSKTTDLKEKVFEFSCVILQQ